VFHVKQNQMSNLTFDRPLLLGGFMGTGKSTVGPIVATQANVPFVDLDATIELATGSTIATIFDSAGEPAFRKLEADTLRHLLTSPEPRVIALGGGTLVDPSLRNEALSKAHVVNLVAHPDTIHKRLHSPGRPLLDNATNPLERIRSLLASRTHAYIDAHARICTDDRQPHDVAHSVLYAWHDRALLVRTSTTSYAARITHDAPRALVELIRTLAPSSVFVVTDQNVDPLYAQPAIDALRIANIPVSGTVVLTPGEAHKQWPAVQQILESLVANGADRNSLVIAIGGGVVSDIAGFAASILLRGVRWIAVPTTMLSMVDAAVGGKTAVDLGLAKNAVGAFHQPAGVIIDPSYTRTESNRAYISGLAEVLKSGAIADPVLVDFVQNNTAQILDRDPTAIEEMIHRSLQVKTNIVSRDERESSERMLLNFGHTIGHGLEAASNYSRLTHGEAVALGMIAILRFGQARGVTTPETANRIEAILAALGLPTNLAEEPLEDALALVVFDKKRVASNLRIVLLEQIGKPRLDVVPINDVRAFFRRNETIRNETLGDLGREAKSWVR
jgi:shikimate kinase/3-dehydroquinate synthase